MEEEFWANPPWDKEPVNEPELVDDPHLLSYKETLAKAAYYRHIAEWVEAGSVPADIFLSGLGVAADVYAAGLELSAASLEECVTTGKAIGGKPGRYGTCYVSEDTFLGAPVVAEAELCLYKETRSWGKKSHNYYECASGAERKQ
jgi:hypothetical protein